MRHQVSLSAYKDQPFVPSLSQMNPVHTLKFFFFKTTFNIIFPSTPRSPKCLVLLFKLFATVRIELGTGQYIDFTWRR
jgi:hypothetical protein